MLILNRKGIDIVTIGERIRLLRKDRGMTQEDVGKILGIQRAGVQKYENDAVSNISIAVIEKLAEAFEVSPSYLAGWDSKEATLAKEVKLLQAINESYGKTTVDMLTAYTILNDLGRRKILDYTRDLVATSLYSVQDK